MKRGGPLKRTTPLKQGDKGLKRTPPGPGKNDGLKRTRIKPRSDGRSDFMRDVRVPAVRSLVESGEICRIGPLLSAEGLGPNCMIVVQGLHERRKRSAGGSLTNPENLIPACNVCNGWVEDFPQLAREVFGSVLVVREGDPEWESLGRRSD